MSTRTKTPFTFLRTLQVASLSLLGCGFVLSGTACLDLTPVPADPNSNQGPGNFIEGGYLTPDPGARKGGKNPSNEASPGAEVSDKAEVSEEDESAWPSGSGDEKDDSMAPEGEEDGGGDEDAGSGSDDMPKGGDKKEGKDEKSPGKILEEADSVHMEGDIAYVLSEYSGLHILNLRDPAQPTILGAKTLDGAPFEMYVRDGVVIVMVRDQFLFDGLTQSWKTSSSVVRLNVANPARIQVIDENRVLGRISDSRLDGEIMYVVSYEDGECFECGDESQVRVSSIFTKKGQPLRRIDQELFAQAERLIGAPSAYFGKDQIFVTIPKWINDGEKGTVARAHFDAATGVMQAYNPLAVDGRILSRWQMSQKDDVLRVFSQGTRWDIEPKLETFKLEGDKAGLLAGIDVKLPEPEDIKSARFDGDRAYLITFRRTDPLFTFDLANPAAPRQTGELEIPGWVYHMEPRGNRLIGAGYNVNNRQNRLSLTLFDVSDLTNPKVLNRLEFGGAMADFAEGQDQIHKSIKILDDKKMILVPYLSRYDDGGVEDSEDVDESFDESTFEEDSESGDMEGSASGRRPYARRGDGCEPQWESGIQIFDWDPAAIKLRGKALVKGGAHRSLLHRDRLIALSDSAIAAYNIDNRDNPVLLGEKTIALNAQQLLAMGEHTVRITKGWRGESSRLEVVGKNEVEGVNVLSSISLGALDDDGCADGRDVRVEKVFANGNNVYVMYQDWYSSYRTRKVAVVSLADPANPKVLGSTSVASGRYNPTFALGSVRVASSTFGGLGDRVVLAAVREIWDDDDRERELSTRFTVLRVDPVKGLVKELELDRDDTRYAGGLIPAGNELASWHARETEKPGVLKFYYDRFYVDVNGKINHEAVNVPGAPIGRDSIHQRLFTMNFLLEEVELDPVSCKAHARYREWDWETSRCVLLKTKLTQLALPPKAPAKVIDERELVADDQTQRTVFFHQDRIFATATQANEKSGGTRIMAGLDGAGQLRMARFDAKEELGQLIRLSDAQVMEQMNKRELRVLDARNVDLMVHRRYETPFRWCHSPVSRGNQLQCALQRHGVRVLEPTN